MILRKTLMLIMIIQLISIFSLSGATCTYFRYTEEELAPLYKLNTDKEMTKNELIQWDDNAFELIDQQDQEENSTRIFAYLYVAQQDAACLSQRVKKKLAGSLDPVSRKILSLFFSEVNVTENEEKSDEYSEALADLVLSKIRSRLAFDQSGTKHYDQKKGEEYWLGREPFYGHSTGSWKPWVMKSSRQFRVPPPPSHTSPVWEDQLRQVKEFCDHASVEEKQKIYYWAGISTSERVANKNGDWRDIVNQYLWKKNVPLKKAILVRAAIAVGREDAAIACFDSKYTYWVKRPSMLDQSLKPIIPVPNHPSYPSGHSTVGSTMAVIMSYFFPEDQEKWNQLATAAGHSRICAGIHFPIDHEKGMEMGQKIGQLIVERMRQIQNP